MDSLVKEIARVIDNRCEADLGQVHANSKGGKVTKTVGTTLIAKDILEYLSRSYVIVDKSEYKELLELRKKESGACWAITLHRDCYGKFRYHIDLALIAYDKEDGRVAVNVDGVLYVTSKSLIFKTEPEAKAGLDLLLSDKSFCISNQ